MQEHWRRVHRPVLEAFEPYRTPLVAVDPRDGTIIKEQFEKMMRSHYIFESGKR